MQDVLDIDQINEDEMRGKYLTFLVDGTGYGIEISCVTEIIGVQDITHVPHTHGYVKGIINLRGTIVPVMNLRLRFGYEEIAYTEKNCIIVLSLEDMSVGIIVDEVQDVTVISEDSQQEPPRTVGGSVNNRFIKAVGYSGDSVRQIIDVYRVFEVENEVAH